MSILDEDSIDEILYLARANEAQELEEFLSKLATQSKHSKSELIAAAVDPYTKNTALHYAAANGHLGTVVQPTASPRGVLTTIVDVLKVLLPPQAAEKATEPASGPINAVNDAGNTPLHWAALNGHLECVKLLMHSGADITIFNKAGHDAVFEAELNDKGDVVDWLLSEVEELEKAIGQNGAGLSGTGEEEEMKVTAGASTSNTADVEGLTKDAENLNVNERTSQGG